MFGITAFYDSRHYDQNSSHAKANGEYSNMSAADYLRLLLHSLANNKNEALKKEIKFKQLDTKLDIVQENRSNRVMSCKDFETPLRKYSHRRSVGSTSFTQR